MQKPSAVYGRDAMPQPRAALAQAAGVAATARARPQAVRGGLKQPCQLPETRQDVLERLFSSRIS